MSETIETPKIEQEDKSQNYPSDLSKIKSGKDMPLWIFRGYIQNAFEAWLKNVGGELAKELYSELLESWYFISWDNQMREGKQLGSKAERFVKRSRRNLPALAKKFQSLIGNEWAQKQDWRQPYPDESGKAQAIRQTLVNLELYPTGWIDKDQDLSWEEINNRAALHVIVNELPREELRAVFDLARLLLLEKDDGSGVENAARKAAEFIKFFEANPDQFKPK
jgi:hypothetical protein